MWCIAVDPAHTASATPGPHEFPRPTLCIGIDTAIDVHCIVDIITIIIFGDIPADTVPSGITDICDIQITFCIGSTGNSREGWHASAGQIDASFDATRTVDRPNPICLARYPEQSTGSVRCADLRQRSATPDQSRGRRSNAQTKANMAPPEMGHQ